MWSKNLVLLANMPPQVGQAATFSWVWLRRCSRSLQWSLKVQEQPGKEGPVVLQHKPSAGLGTRVSPEAASLALQAQPSCSGPQQSQGLFRGQKLRSGPTFPATQHYVGVLANSFVFTTQAVCFHVPVEPLGIVEGALCRRTR